MLILTYLVLAEIFDEKAVLLKVPSDLRVLLADRVLIRKAEIIRVITSLLPPDINLQRTVLLDIELSSVLGDDFGVGGRPWLPLLQVYLPGLLTSFHRHKHTPVLSKNISKRKPERKN